jgi:hypothetical protein
VGDTTGPGHVTGRNDTEGRVPGEPHTEREREIEIEREREREREGERERERERERQISRPSHYLVGASVDPWAAGPNKRVKKREREREKDRGGEEDREKREKE